MPKTEFAPYRLHAVLFDSAHQHEPKKNGLENASTSHPKVS
jgi:hypothetical protein